MKKKKRDLENAGWRDLVDGVGDCHGERHAPTHLLSLLNIQVLAFWVSVFCFWRFGFGFCF